MARGRRRAANPTLVKTLPPCPGPKLHIFQHWEAPIRWLERLDESRVEGSGIQGYVFKVEIASQEYALKVFKFFDLSATEYYWGPLLGESFPRKTIAFHTDPFYAECRAYGRIIEAQEKGILGRQVVIPCHGFLFLQPRDEQILEEKGIDLGASDLDGGVGQGKKRKNRVRAIVKELAPHNVGISTRNIRKALRGVRSLNQLRIYNRDIRSENFRNAKLVDFGSACTEPHCYLDSFDEVEARDTRLEDLVMFDDMIEEDGIRTGVRAMPNFSYCKKLRSSGKSALGSSS